MQKAEKHWGHELIVVNSERAGYCLKIMVMNGKGGCTIERHRMKDETFYILSGLVSIEIFGNGPAPVYGPALAYTSGEYLRIRPGTWHRFSSQRADTVFVEGSTFHDDAGTEKWEGEVV